MKARIMKGRGLVLVLSLCLALAVSCAASKETTCDIYSRRTDCGYLGINQSECEAKGCCWSPASDDAPSCFYGLPGICGVNAPGTDCGYVGIDQSECESRGCCWSQAEGGARCFYGTANDNYIVSSVSKTKLGFTLILKYNGTSPSTPYGPDVTTVQVDIEQQTNERLHIKFTDPSTPRWEVPTNLSPIPTPPPDPPSNPFYDILLPETGDLFNFTIVRKSDGSVIFSNNQTVGALRFVDQYLSLGTALPVDYNVYGLGEHIFPDFRLKSSQTLTLFNADFGTPVHTNLYGSHPFYLEMRPSGIAHGVYLRNSNGMDIDLGSESLVYRTIGGVLDFYFFLGPSPEGVVQQYQEVIGRPHMPPYWSLGFHNCRYGYPNVETLEEVVANYSKALIPLETMWTDIDYMDQKKDFTLDPVNFPQDKMNIFVDNLHNNGQRYVVIVDPGIKNETGYFTYDQGLQANAFIKDKNGKVFFGKVWPGYTAFTDFMNFDTHQYWENQIAMFLKLLPVDGLWIDMNEISNFCNGTCSTNENGVKSKTLSQYTSQRQDHGHLKFNPVDPPYSINNRDNHSPLNTKTIDMDALHMNGTVLEYNAHSIYGLSEAYATNKALEKLKKKRSFVLSRSTFPGSGSHTGHWTGDNEPTFDALRHSIVGMLNFQLFSIPLVGSDICGFHGTTTVELCTRWIEVGAFYPFSRDHNSLDSPSQELYRWPQVAEVARKVLSIRYSLLPLYYTLFYKAHAPVPTATGSTQSPAATVVRPLFFEFPSDAETFAVSTEFLIGSAVMISPVVAEGATDRKAYFPRARWYDWYNQSVITEKGGETLILSAPVEHVPIHLRGGAVIPIQEPGMTTEASRRNPFSLLVVLDENGAASGDIYLDDGESLDMSNYTYVTFSCYKSTLTSNVTGTGYARAAPPLSSVNVLGLNGAVSKATLNGQPVSGVQYNSTSHSVLLSGFQTSLGSQFTVIWD